MKLNEVIKYLRKKSKLTQVQLSQLTGISQASISQMEKELNPKRPHENTLERIAKACNTNVATIYACAFELHELQEVMTVLNLKCSFEITIKQDKITAMKKPSDFIAHPFGSVLRKSEAEIIAANIMRILKRTGNEWRELTWEQYKEERLKDGRFTESERGYFDDVIDYCKSPETAKLFSPSWKEKFEEVAGTLEVDV